MYQMMEVVKNSNEQVCSIKRPPVSRQKREPELVRARAPVQQTETEENQNGCDGTEHQQKAIAARQAPQHDVLEQHDAIGRRHQVRY